MAFMCSCNFEPGKSLDVDHFLNIAQGVHHLFCWQMD